MHVMLLRCISYNAVTFQFQFPVQVDIHYVSILASFAGSVIMSYHFIIIIIIIIIYNIPLLCIFVCYSCAVYVSTSISS